MRRTAVMAQLSALWASALLALAGCGSGRSPSPFVSDAGADAAHEAGDAASDSEGPDPGRPCVDDAQCDDELDCTFDECDLSAQRCRNTPDDTRCIDAVYCDGLEVCDRLLGCIEGAPITCSDDDTCTIDACVEDSLTCSHAPRDADGDGDPDRNCGGGDCNDTNRAVSGLLPEICGNGIDDDCDDTIDEVDCSQVQHDDCGDALDVLADGTYLLSTAGADKDHGSVCAAGSDVDVVLAVVVPEPGPMDVDLIARSNQPVALALAEQCGDPAGELSCNTGVPTQAGQYVSRLRARSLAAGAYPVYLFAPSGQAQEVSVNFRAPSAPPINETCGTAEPLALRQHVTAEVIGVTADLQSACSVATGELVYQFSLSEPRDIRIYATSLDGVGQPSISLRNQACTGLAAEIACQTGPAPVVFARSLAAGDYYVSVSATAPTEVDLVVEDTAPSPPPEGEDCTAPPPLTPGVSLPVDLSDHVHDVDVSCLSAAADAVYELDLPAPSDVLLVERISSGDTGALALLTAGPGGAGCGAELACRRGSSSPVRLRRHAVPQGKKRVVVQSARGAPVDLTAFTRPAAAPILAAFADTCASAVQIPAEGGFFQGNTANAAADYDAGCDFGLQPTGGAPDQMLRLSLAEPRRVIFDMQGSGYQTLLNVRKGPTCPGAEIVGACAAGYVADRSYLDLQLEAGEYYVQVDGYNMDSGAWFLDVFVVAP